MKRDPLYKEAKEIVLKYKVASAPFLQRKMKIGHARVATLLYLLEVNGIIGAYNESEPREVLI